MTKCDNESTNGIEPVDFDDVRIRLAGQELEACISRLQRAEFLCNLAIHILSQGVGAVTEQALQEATT